MRACSVCFSSDLKGFLDNLDRGNYVPLESKGYGSLSKYVTMVFKSPRAIKMLCSRLLQIAVRPRVAWYAVRGFALTLARGRRHARLFGVFQFRSERLPRQFGSRQLCSAGI